MKIHRMVTTILLAGALLVGLANPVLALVTQTEHWFAGGVTPKEVASAIHQDPELLFGLGTVSNRVVHGSSSQEFDTSAYWAAGVGSVHVEMTMRENWSCQRFPCPRYHPWEITLRLSNGAEGVVRHTFTPGPLGQWPAPPLSYTNTMQWTNDYGALESGDGALADALLHEVHNLVVIPNVKALVAWLLVEG